MTIQTAVLIETLKALGGDIRWCSCNIFSSPTLGGTGCGPPSLQRIGIDAHSFGSLFPTGREWAVVSGEGLHIYSLDDDMIFDPISLTEDIDDMSRTTFALESGATGCRRELRKRNGVSSCVDTCQRFVVNDGSASTVRTPISLGMTTTLSRETTT